METQQDRRRAWVLPVVGLVTVAVVALAVWGGLVWWPGSDLDTAQALMDDWAATSTLDDAEGVAALFAEDGVLLTGDGTFVGREQISVYVSSVAAEAADFEAFGGEESDSGSFVFTVSWRSPLDLDGTAHFMTVVAEAELELAGDRIGRLELRTAG